MKMIKGKTARVSQFVIFALLLIIMVVAIATNLLSPKTKDIPTSIAVPPQKVRSIKSITRDPSSLDIIVRYTDGTRANVGHISPLKGTVDTSQVQLAVNSYCAAHGGCTGRDGRDVTYSQVAQAVREYCSQDRCKGVDGIDGKDGVDGKDAKEITDDQIAQAVANFCTSNNCKGDKGDKGDKGSDGKDGTLLNCSLDSNGKAVISSVGETNTTPVVKVDGDCL